MTVVLALLILILMFYHRRRRLANRNAILLQHQQQNQQGRPAQWGALNGVTHPPYGQSPGQPYGQQPPYGQQIPHAQPYGGGGYQYPAPANTNALPNNQQAPYVYNVTTPAINTKGYEVSNDTPSSVQPPARAYDPSQPNTVCT